ncbi:hypothetical protein [Cupriavidus taiwanensis]|uniref:hypothetical protein n=1 Tax=Cupriavidus taiwanensis TaxID=164546 RepID=UPI000E18E412|nr:hypothetical protein [Cupriavidus taiwanensis]SOZ97311.1 conserved exported hypothetical protein [Cupriavidus taiwanensis]
MNIRYVLRNLTGLLVGLFFIGSVQAQTRLIWDSNGNIVGSELQSSYDGRMQLSRDLTAYNQARNAGAISSATLEGGKVKAVRAASLSWAATSGLGKAAALGLEEFVRYPLSSVGKGLVNLARLNPLSLAGTVAADMLLTKAISACQQPGGWCYTPKADPKVDPGRVCNSAGNNCLDNVTYQQWVLNGRPTANTFQPLTCYDSGCTYVKLTYRWNNNWYEDEMRMTVVPAGTPVPATDAQIDQAIQDGITATPAKSLDVLRNIYDQGGWVPLDAADQAGFNVPTPTVDGKPTTTTTTSTAPDGSTLTTTKTTTPKATVSSSGDTVTNNTLTYNITNVSTSVTRNEAGTIVGSETTTEDNADGFSDAAMPALPKLYEQKYPEGIAGVWQESKPDITTTGFYQGVASMFPSFGGGQCPVWGLSFNLGAAGNFGSGNLTVPCWIFQALGLVILATAAFTSRKILF